jgi:cytochrome d ubiquinol oxidase subunit I
MDDPTTLHRVHFALTIIFHYLFPQITMGLALLIVVLKTMGLRGDVWADAAARFWIRVFGVAFVFGVVTGIPMEFQFGTNWSRFSERAGGVVGQTLAMEGVFAFFLESAFLYALIAQEKRLGRRGHYAVAWLLFFGTWLSAYFITATNAWMQHPVAYEIGDDGRLALTSLWGLLTNPWLFVQYGHVMCGTVITASFVMAGVGAYWMLHGEHDEVARRCVGVGLVAGFVSSVLAAMPTGDLQAKLVYVHKPVAFAAMEGHYKTEERAGLVIMGQPNAAEGRVDNPVVLPRVLSFLTHRRWTGEIKGLHEFPREEWPDNPDLLYYAYHIMAGLGTIFILVTGLGIVFLWRRSLVRRRWLLWVLMLAMPFPFIANTAGWATAELGRQPWVVYGVMRTAAGSSEHVSRGNVMFTLLGFSGLYVLLGLLFCVIMIRMIGRGPGDAHAA